MTACKLKRSARVRVEVRGKKVQKRLRTLGLEFRESEGALTFSMEPASAVELLGHLRLEFPIAYVQGWIE